MGILDSMDFENLQEEKPLTDGEYEVQIMSAEEYIGKQSGKTSIRVILTVPGEADAQDIFHYLSLPQDGDDPKTANRKMRRIRDFLEAFGLSKSTPYEDWVGHKSWAILKTEEDDKGEPRNTITRFLGRSDNSNITNDRPKAGFEDLPF